MKRKQAVLIIAHNQIQLLKLLISQLDNEWIDIYLHFDAKYYHMWSEEIEGIRCKYSQLYIFRKFKIRWGDFSQIQCELFLLENAVKKGYYYYHLISGVDFPIKSTIDIVNYFSDKREEFVNFSHPTAQVKSRDRVKYYYMFTHFFAKKGMRIDVLLTKLQYVLGINRLRNMRCDIYKGSNWFSITDNLAREVCNRKAWIYRHFKFTLCCDEVFLQTILMDSLHRENLSIHADESPLNAAKRYIDWNRGNPYVLKREDCNLIINSPAMFARKFDYEKYPEIIDFLVQRFHKASL